MWLVVAAVAAARPAPADDARARSVRSLDAEWRFHCGEAVGAEQPAFDDSGWRVVDVPHDWSIEGPYHRGAPAGRGGGYLPSGSSWYRKAFTLQPGDQGRRVFLEFDGVMAGSRVWINGSHLGHRPNGYVSFRYDLTDHVRFDRPNLVAVRTDTTLQPASRWYTGQGIYRHVRLVVADPVRIEPWGVFLTTPEVTADRAVVRAQTAVVNGSADLRELAVRTMLRDASGRVVADATTPPERVPSGASLEFRQDLAVAAPERWDVDRPRLYTAVSQVVSGGRVHDDEVTTFGIRTFRFESATGFWLNGRNLKLRGVCLHHDGGAVGAAVPLRVWERRLERLRTIGVNAIRTAHNPPAPEFLDLCDRMGFLVMDELWDAWTVGKNHANYGVHLYFREWWEADTRDTVRRDRNHPSVVLWSAGNEIRDTPQAELAKGILRGLLGVFHGHDPTRPVTQGLFRPNVSRDYDNGLADLLDVVGQNYREGELIAAHRQNPARKVLGTENNHSRETWLALRDHPFLAGQFLWAGIEYLGEADWPFTTFTPALLDRSGELLPRAYQRQSWWSSEPMVHVVRRTAPAPPTVVDPGYETAQELALVQREGTDLRADWTPAAGEAGDQTVEVYSNAPQVELVLNGRRLGTKTPPQDASPRQWEVPFEAGTLRAVARDGGKVVATHELRTAGAPAAIVLESDRERIAPAWDDVAHLTATIVDAKGVRVPRADHLVRFDVEGPGAIVAVDNGNRASHEPYRASKRRVYQGRALAIVRATAPRGRLTLRASSPGLAGASVTVEAAAAGGDTR